MSSTIESMLEACRRTLVSRVFENQKELDALEEVVVKIEASIESGEKREWTENEITSELELTTDDCFVSEAYIRVIVNTLRHRYRTEKLCSYIFKPRHRCTSLYDCEVCGTEGRYSDSGHLRTKKAVPSPKVLQ